MTLFGERRGQRIEVASRIKLPVAQGRSEESTGYVVDEGEYGSDACLSSRTLLVAVQTWISSCIRTFMLDLVLYARLTTSSKAIRADRLEVFRDIIHFLFLEVRDNDIYFIASGVVHSAQ